MRTITILASDLNSNSLQRAYTFATLLEHEFRVQVVGHTASGDIWTPLRDKGVDYRRVTFASALTPRTLPTRTLKQLIAGSLIIAHKAVNSSFGLGLRARRRLGIPLLIDVEESELGLLGESVYWEFRNAPRDWLLGVNSPLYTRLLDRQIRTADSITVTNSVLQHRYGGTLIPHARDESVFYPATLPQGGRVMFLGSIRPHKGLGLLLEAWPRVASPGASLHIIGTPLDEPGVASLRERAPSNVHFEGHVPHERVPEILRTASMFVIPQLASAAAEGQLPTKLVEAMATGLPIVASAVGDIPHWLRDDAGVVVPPGDAVALGAAIQSLLADVGRARLFGANARQRFLDEASFAAIRPRLSRLVNQVIRNANS